MNKFLNLKEVQPLCALLSKTPLIMRISLVLLFVFAFQIHAEHADSQEAKLSIDLKNSSIEKVLQTIEQKSDYYFLYSNRLIDVDRKVSIKAKNAVISSVLDRLFNPQDVEYEIKGSQIILSPKEISEITTELLASQQQQQGKTITGTIVDEQGEAIIGANIIEKGTSNGTITDIDGNFSLNVSDDAVLRISYIGYLDQELASESKKIIKVVLKEDLQALDEVVVIGYGEQKKSSVVASLSTIGSKQLTIKQRNLRNTIAGQIPGVIAVQRSGEPGNDAAAFYIRGQSSYAGGTSPLVLVDGVPRSMDDIDVDEIESFTVLKDAAATAVYGAEGANGVVLITSKRGRKQKTMINLTAQYSIITPQRMPQTLDAYSYLSLWNEAVWNDQGNPWDSFFIPEIPNSTLKQYQIGEDLDLYPSVNWSDLLNNQTHSQRYTLSFRGGSEKNRYFVSGSYYSEDGIFNSNPIEKYDANIGLERFNLRSNVDMDLTETTLLSVDMSGQYLSRNTPGFSSDEIFEQISHFPTHVIPMYYSDGTASEHPSQGWGTIHQPYNMLNNSGYTKTWNAFIQSKATLNQKLDIITKGLSIKGILSFDADYTSGMTRSKTPKSYYASERDLDGNLLKKIIKEGEALSDPWNSAAHGAKKIYIEGSLNYSRNFIDKHDITGLLLYMQKETQYQNTQGLQLLPFRKQSVVGRTTYAYDDRYMLEASMGITGSENFAEGKRWGVFPALGAAWYISHEDFMRNIEGHVSKLKLRASIGMTGNDAIGSNIRFPYRGTVNVGGGGYNFGLTPGANGGASNWVSGVVEGSFGAPSLSWEKERKINLGIDLGLFRGKVDLGLDFFSNRRHDILIQRETISSVTGFRDMPFQNFGITTNKGMDGSVILSNNIGEVNVSARGNITYARNKIKEKDEVPQVYPWLLQTGNRIGQPLLYIDDGLYTPDDFDIEYNISNGAQTYILKDHLPKPSANVAPGDIKYKDLNNDGIIDSYDRTYNNDQYASLPEVVYGFGINAEWKGLFIAVFFQGVAQTSTNMISSLSNIVPFTIGIDRTSARTEVLSRWRADEPYNQDIFFPRLHPKPFAHNTFNSTWWYRDAGFLRLKNVEIGYEFDTDLLRRININNSRIYLQGNNIAVWDKVKYWDPELGHAASGAKYPLSSTYTIGLEVTF